MMKNKVLRVISAVLFTAVIIIIGVNLPVFLLNETRKSLSEKEGRADTKDLAVYGDDEIGTKALNGRIEKLSKAVNSFLDGEELKDVLVVAKRKTLDTELTKEDAIYQAQSVIYKINTEFSNAGYSISNQEYSIFDGQISDTGTSDTDIQDAEASDGNIFDNGHYMYLETNLYELKGDSSLSMWCVYIGDCVVMIDAVSGTPLYVMGNVDKKGTNESSDKDFIWDTARKLYNAHDIKGVHFEFDKNAVKSKEEQAGTNGCVNYLWSKSSGDFTLKVQLTEYGNVSFMNFNIFIEPD